jgi:hypothetical protein
MIYIPWIVFALAICYMMYQGDKAKRDYLRRKADENNQPITPQNVMVAAAGMMHQGSSAPAYNQSQNPDPGKTFGFAGGTQQGK